ncbi:hypothetical protein HDV00_000762 [Rhizophlyctis rosea]|nr:hypothetical protein HDV00_000762 [Rhizophlyctis rosea]
MAPNDTSSQPTQVYAEYSGPVSWEEILDIKHRFQRDDTALHRFCRTDTVLARYKEWRAEVVERFDGVADYMKSEVLSFPTETNPETNKLKTVWPSDRSTLRNRILRLNDFPYATVPSENILHYVLWSLEDLSEEEVSQILDAKLPDWEHVFFVNPPHRKTIPEIPHYHVFVRPRPPTSMRIE